MKKFRFIISLASVILISSFCTISYAQTNSAAKPKSRTAYEEKTVKGVKSTEIDSEEKYDALGNIVDEIDYKDGKINKHYVYEYDTRGNKIKETELDTSGKTKKVSEYKYENGLKTEKLVYDSAKKLISRKTYTYSY
ncbi:MAG: hypothetical protein H6540_02885 [Bacteroidales bacterium]|nr:hypothetical protein [Bacteroidales bacterium]